MSWPTVKLGSKATVLMGQSPDGSLYNTDAIGLPLITGAGQFGERFPEPTQFSQSGAKQSIAGDIIIGIRATIGVLNWADKPYYLGRGVAAIRAKDGLDARYLWRVLETSRRVLESRATGSTFRQIKREDIESFEIPLPPLPEQRRIAAILDHADALRAKRRAAIAKLDSLAKSIFLDIFGDCEKNPRAWPTATLGELIKSGPQNGLYKPANLYGAGTSILRIDSFYDGEVTSLSELKRVTISNAERSLYGLDQEDIVVNRVNSLPFLGKSALIPALPESTVFESNIMRFRVDESTVLPLFVVSVLQTQFIKAQILGRAKKAVNQASINQEDIRSLRLFVPPLQLQSRYRNTILAVAANRLAQHRSSISLETMVSGIQHRAFQGNL